LIHRLAVSKFEGYYSNEVTMPSPEYQFTEIIRLEPESVGEPGKRTFRLIAESGTSSAILWLEKEQLFQLALAAQQVCDELPSSGDTADAPSELEAPELTILEFQINKLAMGHDQTRSMFIIDAYDFEAPEPTIRIWATRNQIESFLSEAMRVVTSGRPLCPLCSNPINPDGHQCPRSNGKVHIDRIFE
jgi:uncharacterized repeat protein (TIGR03847 family)